MAGDFNTYPIGTPSINAPTTGSKRRIYNHLQDWSDIIKTVNKKDDFTHITQTSASRIDQIWCTNHLGNKILDAKTFDSPSINTDHKQVQVIFDWFEFKLAAPGCQTKVFDWKIATEQQKANFKEEVDF